MKNPYFSMESGGLSILFCGGYTILYICDNEKNKIYYSMRRLNFMRVGALLLLCSLSFSLLAQEQSAPLSQAMTLEQCLDYARQNSITLQQVKLQVDNSAAEQLAAKGSFLPTISGSVAQEISASPLNDNNTSSYGGSYGVDLSMTLYNGGRNRASLEQSQIGADMAELSYNEYSASLEVAVTEVYVQILYTLEQISAAESSLALSDENLSRGAVLLSVGSISSVDYAQLESAKATSEYNLVAVQTQLRSLNVSLKHLLEISNDATLEVVAPTLSDDMLMAHLPSVSDVYETAIDMRPEILSSQLGVEVAELDAAIAKAAYLPTLRLTAGTGVSHISSSSYDFSSQLRNNFNTSAGLSLSIPIFNGYANRSAVTVANNSVKSASLSLTEAEKSLYQTIESLHSNATSAQAKFAVSEYMVEASAKSLELTTEQYELGAKSTIELLTEQDNFTQTENEYIINKYQLILNKALLNFYKTNIIKL